MAYQFGKKKMNSRWLCFKVFKIKFILILILSINLRNLYGIAWTESQQSNSTTIYKEEDIFNPPMSCKIVNFYQNLNDEWLLECAFLY